MAENDWGGLSGAYDVNSDGIDDLVYLVTGAGDARFELSVSQVGVQELPLTRLDCPALQALPSGRLFLRDLNADGAPDFIIAARNGLRIYLNLPEDFTAVAAWDFPDQQGRWAALELEAGDLDGDGLTDLAIGYDRVESELAGTPTTGILRMLQNADESWSEPVQEETTWFEARFFLSGDLALGRFLDESRHIFVPAESGYPIEDGFLGAMLDHELMVYEEITRGEPTGSELRPLRSMAVPLAPERDALAIVSARRVELFEIVGYQAKVLASLETVFEHDSMINDPGAGPARPREFFEDLDRDGDLDFIELSLPPARAAVHNNLGDYRFAAPQELDLDLSTRSESPIFRVGPISGLVAGDLAGRPELRTLVAAP